MPPKYRLINALNLHCRALNDLKQSLIVGHRPDVYPAPSSRTGILHARAARELGLRQAAGVVFPEQSLHAFGRHQPPSAPIPLRTIIDQFSRKRFHPDSLSDASRCA